jgi:uncharacterized protein (TIGR00303 family)
MEYTIHLGDFEPFINAIKQGFIFTLTIGTTDVSLIPGITIAGAKPELTHFTPAADAEYLLLGKCRVINTVPMTPDGKPTPALITRAALRLINAGVLVVNAGSRVKPLIPHVDLQGEPGLDIIKSDALRRNVVERMVDNGLVLGENLGRSFRVLIIGESIPAGTTTAMAFLVAMGYDAWHKMSSASPTNPRELKISVVKRALERAGVSKALDDPILAVSKVGDPVIPAIASIAIGAARAESHVILAGGTQMGAVLAFIKAFDKSALSRLAIATTRWLINDKSADLVGLVKEIHPIPVVSSNLNFDDMPYEGLRAFEEGFVKEGVGAGGSLVAASIMGFDLGRVKMAILRDYEELLKTLRVQGM